MWRRYWGWCLRSSAWGSEEPVVGGVLRVELEEG